MVSNLKLAVAIASVLAAGSTYATAPTPAQAQATQYPLYMAGSSAAVNGVLGVLEKTLCGGSYSLFSSTGDTNFFAVSCTPASGLFTGANGTDVYTVWYRDEGGSVTGALPLVTGSSINQMLLTATTSSSSPYTVAISGSSALNGIDDSFGSGVFKAPVYFGITDVEPGQLIGNNYPSAYKTSVYGHATSAQLAALATTAVFDQVFGIFVNTSSGFTEGTSGQGSSTASLALPYQTITNILNGSVSDWSTVTDVNGNAPSAGLPITIVNREQGSGSRTATDIFFTTDQCNKASVSPIQESTGGTADYFSTGNVLAAANGIPGAITYASIDNAGNASYPNLTLVAINGVQPSNLAAAAGAYNDWFEATAVTGPNLGSLPSNTQNLIAFLKTKLSVEATAPGAVDVLAVPSSVNTPNVPVSSTASVNNGKTIYINPFTRNKNSCAVPAFL